MVESTAHFDMRCVWQQLYDLLIERGVVFKLERTLENHFGSPL